MIELENLEKFGLSADKALPKHIAIIMDGNGRWAKKQGLIRLAGHRAGIKTIREILEVVTKLGIKYFTIFAFSTENWKRPTNEVDGLMQLLIEFMDKELPYLHQEGVKIQIIGDRERLPKDVYTSIEKAETLTKDNTVCFFNIALNYGSRQELIRATRLIAKEAMAGELDIDSLDEQVFSNYLYTQGQPDPDLLIRTSGEMRISNFLLWQIAYAEIWVTPVLWPDFRKEHLIEGLQVYQARDRRFGGLK